MTVVDTASFLMTRLIHICGKNSCRILENGVPRAGYRERVRCNNVGFPCGCSIRWKNIKISSYICINGAG